jgi:hypothetical protein
MNLYKSLIIIALCLPPPLLTAQSLCYKNIVTQPAFSKKTVEVVTVPAVYETRYEQIVVKSAHTRIEKRDGMDCAIAVPAVTRTIAMTYQKKPAVVELVEVEELTTDGSVKQVVTDCGTH